MSYYFVDKNLEGYGKESIQALSCELEKSGFKYKQAQLGGGPSEVIQQVVAHLSIHEVLVGIFTGIAANRIDKLLSRLYEWYKNNKKSNNAVQPVVSIYIYSKKSPISLIFPIDKATTRKEISKSVSEAKLAARNNK